MKGFLLTLLVFFVQQVYAQKDCRHTEYEHNTIADHPELFARFHEAAPLSTVRAREAGTAGEQSAALPAIITIPVVVHILHHNGEQNLSHEQVMSQIEALNRDFRGMNEDRQKTPAHFAALAADCGIEFKLAKRDPSGKPTTGIIRKQTRIEYFGLDDRAKTSSRGGDDAWDPSQYLNIWVCNLAGGVLGYSSTPGGPAEKDGVVISTYAFGTKGKVRSPFNFGRTATHEIGHWLNLRHIWGDTYCGDDKVDDTPQQRSSNKGCPSGKLFSCGSEANGDMYMNFMDLSDDACMVMFTHGQKDRMRSLFNRDNIRHSLLSSKALDAAVIPQEEQPAVPESPVNASAERGISLYPNPVSSMLTVSLQTSEKETNADVEMVIYNHVGKPVMKAYLKGQKTINISSLKPGLYYLHILDGQSKQIKKFMKL